MFSLLVFDVIVRIILNLCHNNVRGTEFMEANTTVLSLMKERGGYLSAKEAREGGVDNNALRRMAKCGLIDRVAHGLYVGTDVIPDPFFVAQRRCPRGVFSHETALFFHDLSDRAPLQIMMTIPSGWNTRLLSESKNGEIMFFYTKPQHASLGAVRAMTPFGNSVTVYDTPRTICDCLRSIERLDKDLVLTALKRHIKDRSTDKAKLLEYAATFKIQSKVMMYLEVLS